MEEKSLGIATRLAPALGEAAAAQQASLVLWVRPLDYLPVVSAIAGGARRAADRAAATRSSTGAISRPCSRRSVRSSGCAVTVAPGGSEARLGWGER